MSVLDVSEGSRADKAFVGRFLALDRDFYRCIERETGIIHFICNAFVSSAGLKHFATFYQIL